MSIRADVVKARVATNIKHDAEIVLHKLGLTLSDAINLLLIQIKLRKALPFEIKIPNAETQKVLEETDKGEGLKKAKSVKDMFDQIGV